VTQTQGQPDPSQILMQILFGKFVSRAVTAVAEAGVADHITDDAVPVTELAAATATDEDGLYRVMRALSATGVFIEAPGRCFAHNAVSRLLRSDVEGSQRNMARWINCGPAWSAWGRLDFSLKTGKPAFEEVHGTPIFDFLFKREPIIGEIFEGAMTDFSVVTGGAVAEAYDFSGFGKLVDVGGGHGGLLAAILRRHADVRGVLFDLAEVVAGAPGLLGDLSSRVDIEQGSFFDGVPAGADAYIMKHIIHDWDDESCIKILSHCREGLNEGGKVLVVDMVITDAPESALGKLLDLEMLIMLNGRERTESEFADLFVKAGLRLSRVVATKSPVCLVEAVPA